MPDKKLTNNEIVKALECCNEWKKPGDCTNCPAKGKGDCCVLTLRIAALDLINRLQAELKSNEKIIRLADKTIETANAEIERLKRLLDEEEKKYMLCAKRFFKDGVKEFAERLDNETFGVYYASSLYHVVDIDDVKEILKELVGEENAGSN